MLELKGTNQIGSEGGMELGFFTMPLHPPGANIADTLEADLEQLIYLRSTGVLRGLDRRALHG
jgi:hypothetical protein